MTILPKPERSCLPINIEFAERHYNATFVGDFCIKGKHGWCDEPVALFWQETPPRPEYSNYFALIVRQGVPYIACGQSAADEPITAIVANDGEIVYSRFVHDFRMSRDGSCWIDGGRDYIRSSVGNKYVTLKINGPVVEIHPHPEANCDALLL